MLLVHRSPAADQTRVGWCTSEDPASSLNRHQALDQGPPTWEDLYRPKPVSEILFLLSLIMSLFFSFFLKLRLVVSLDPWVSTSVDNQYALKPTSLSGCLYVYELFYFLYLKSLKFTEFTVQSVCDVVNLMMNKCFGILYK